MNLLREPRHINLAFRQSTTCVVPRGSMTFRARKRSEPKDQSLAAVKKTVLVAKPKLAWAVDDFVSR
jgi:hypothetical protein